jgi:hypothetical protein
MNCVPGERGKGICDVLLIHLKTERRDQYGRKWKVKDQCCGKGRCKKQDKALQPLREQGRGRHGRFPYREEKNETRML